MIKIIKKTLSKDIVDKYINTIMELERGFRLNYSKENLYTDITNATWIMAYGRKRGCGCFNSFYIRNYPIFKKEYDIDDIIENTYKVIDVLKQMMYIPHASVVEYKFADLDLIPIEGEFKITHIIAILLQLFNNNVDTVCFLMGLLTPSLIEMKKIIKM